MRHQQEDRLHKNKKTISVVLFIEILLVLCGIFVLSCKRENLDYTYDYRPNQDAQKASSVRLINLSENNQLIANGDSLTNFFVPPQTNGYIPPEQLTPPGTHYFPKDGRLGLSWFVPQNLFKTDGIANLKTTFEPIPNRPIVSYEVELNLRDDYSKPKDYYLLLNHEGRVTSPDKFVEVPRAVAAPSRPDHFKIRIINFSKKLLSYSSMEDISGAISLTYADGTSVSDATKSIASNQWSEYIELPYGTYQFKVLTANGRQIPGKGQVYYRLIDRQTSTMEMSTGINSNATSGLTYTPMQTFQPGGIYTIVVHPSMFTWSTGRDDISELQNSFQIITDISEPLNQTYSQIQLANTVIGQQALLKVKGQSTAITAYGSASDYTRVVAGKQTVEITSANGQQILSQEVELQSGQNYTAWLYQDKDKKVNMLLAANNLAGTIYTGKDDQGNNATIDRTKSAYPFFFRFLNFCPQIPYTTITNGSGVPYGNLANGNTSGINMTLGVLNTFAPYSSLWYDTAIDQDGFYQFMAYSSAPNRVPGDWLKQISTLSSSQLVANKKLYTNVGRKVPAHEPGVYSIAIIGDLEKTNDAEKAKFMLIKHTK
ncbi:hypothetical protein [Sphingobacterium sp. MYb382]|uniref:hypothetical protein n=1 Tax=Sphingobacterium sp. MYb382 TaxID=2745278 RepID=UPI0030AC1BD8